MKSLIFMLCVFCIGVILGAVLVEQTHQPVEHEAAEVVRENPTELLQLKLFQLESKLEQQYKDEGERRVELRRVYGSWDFTEESGYLLSKICASEDTRFLRSTKDMGTDGELTQDCRLIANVIYNNRSAKRSFKSWIDVMEFMAPHVTGAKDPVQQRQYWLRNLPRHTGLQPDGWVTCLYDNALKQGKPINKPCDGNWDLYSTNWERGRANIISAWMDQSFISPTYAHLRAWGCSGKEGCDDDPQALARGLCKDITLGEQNSFWFFPSKSRPCPQTEQNQLAANP